MLKDIIKPAVILFLICALITGALAYVNGITQPIIIAGNEAAKKEALSKVIPGAADFSEPLSNEAIVQKGFKPTDRILNLFEAMAGGQRIGFVVEVASRGYGGNINMLIGIDNDLKVTGAVVTGHNETPGLGSKAMNNSFLDQYLGALPEGGFHVVKTLKAKDGDISAVSGATITSRAITNGVSDASALVKEIVEGGK